MLFDFSSRKKPVFVRKYERIRFDKLEEVCQHYRDYPKR